jgi:hypothetical protein
VVLCRKKCRSASGHGIISKGYCTYFWVGLDLKPVIAQMTLHSKAPDLAAEIGACLLFLCVEANAFCDMRIATTAPNMPRHFKSNDQDALVEFLRSISKRMLPSEGVDGSLFAGEQKNTHLILKNVLPSRGPILEGNIYL